MIEHRADRQRKGFRKDWIRRARAGDLIINTGDAHRLARSNAIVRPPDFRARRRAVELGGDLHAIKTKGRERGADLLRCAAMQCGDALGGQVVVAAGVLDTELRQHIRRVRAAESFDLYIECERPDWGKGEQSQRQRDGDPECRSLAAPAHCSAMNRAAPSSGVLGCRMTRTGIRRISDPMRPLSKKPSRKPPRRKQARFFSAMPPPR